MCGIVGLFAKSPGIEEHLGAHLVAMLAQMSDRGPDSAGVAVYRDPVADGLTKCVERDGPNSVHRRDLTTTDARRVAAASGSRAFAHVPALRSIARMAHTGAGAGYQNNIGAWPSSTRC